MGVSLVPPGLRLKDIPATSPLPLLLFLQGLEARPGWIRSGARLPEVVGMPGIHQQPVHSFRRGRAEDLPDTGLIEREKECMSSSVGPGTCILDPEGMQKSFK